VGSLVRSPDGRRGTGTRRGRPRCRDRPRIAGTSARAGPGGVCRRRRASVPEWRSASTVRHHGPSSPPAVPPCGPPPDALATDTSTPVGDQPPGDERASPAGRAVGKRDIPGGRPGRWSLDEPIGVDRGVVVDADAGQLLDGLDGQRRAVLAVPTEPCRCGVEVATAACSTRTGVRNVHRLRPSPTTASTGILGTGGRRFRTGGSATTT